MDSFGRRLDAVFDSRGNLCCGIDPHAFLLSEWNLPDSAEGALEFGLRVVEAAAATIGIVKPQIAFFERFGSTGYAALEKVIAAARAAGLLVIADVKRGDVGSTVAAYGAAWLTPGSPLEADAMTISAYQGVGSLTEPIALAHSQGKGLFVLAATSNPESLPTQTAVISRGRFRGSTVVASIVAEVDEINSATGSIGSIGVVLGATNNPLDYQLSPGVLANTPILAPGFGEQGALVRDVRSIYGDLSDNVIVNVGRSVLRSGPRGVLDALRATNSELEEGLAR